MILTVDVGNTNIVYGGFKNGELCFCARVATDARRESDQYAMELAGILALKGFSGEKIKGIAVSCVVPGIGLLLSRAFGQFCAEEPFFLKTSDHEGGSLFGMKINIDNPAELGADIFASALAVSKSRQLPAVIIDMGTATKLCAVNEGGILEGVAISPGFSLSTNALFSGASLIKGIPLDTPGRAVGKNTAESVKSGVIYGTAAMLDGMIARFEDETGPIKTIVATGGVASAVIPFCRHNIQIDENLILYGLYAAYMEACSSN